MTETSSFKTQADILDELKTDWFIRKLNNAEENFYQSDAWRRIRYRILEKYKAKCMCCGARGEHIPLHVDHIKPRSLHPELELDEDNLQILCLDCNVGKSNLFETDWRPSMKPYLDHKRLRAYIKRIEDEKNGLYD